MPLSVRSPHKGKHSDVGADRERRQPLFRSPVRESTDVGADREGKATVVLLARGKALMLVPTVRGRRPLFRSPVRESTELVPTVREGDRCSARP